MDTISTGSERRPSDLADFPPSRKMVLTSLIVGAAIYALGVAAHWSPGPDSALYLSLGRNVAAGNGYVTNGQTNTDVAPGLPWLYAAVFRLAGENYLAFNALAAALAFGALVVCYHLFRQINSPRMALTVVVCCAGSSFYYKYANRLLTDLPFCLLAWASLLWLRRVLAGRRLWIVPAALAAILALLVRIPGILFLAAAFIGLLLDRPPEVEKRTLRTGKWMIGIGGPLLACAIVGGLFWASRQLLPDQQTLYVRSQLSISVVDLWRINIPLAPAAAARSLLDQNAVEVFFLVVIPLAVVGASSLWRRGQRLGAILPWLFLALLCTIGLRPRYFLPAQPFLMYQLLVGLMVVVRTLLPRASAKAALTASIVFVIVILGFGSARIAKQIYQFQMANFSGRPMEYLEGGHYAGVRRTADFVGEYWHDHPDLGEPILLFGEGVSILHYWTGRVIGMPDRPGDPLNEDAALYEYLTSHSLLIVYQEPKGPAGRLEEVRDWLDRREGAEQLYEADGWRIYRTGGETPPGS